MKRDLYYLHSGLFPHQQTSDAAILRFARSANVCVQSLPLIPSAKGLVYGPVQWQEANAEWKSAIAAPTSVPFRPQRVVCRTPIVVVEKESVFHLLSTSKLALSGTVVLVTGKGYPDVSTRAFLHMASCGGSFPIFVLCVVHRTPHFGVALPLRPLIPPQSLWAPLPWTLLPSSRTTSLTPHFGHSP